MMRRHMGLLLALALCSTGAAIAVNQTLVIDSQRGYQPGPSAGIKADRKARKTSRPRWRQ